MNILSMDTSTEILSLELHSSGARIFNVRDFGLRHSEKLTESIRNILDEGGVKPTDLDLLACTGGPGSFTGLRIAMATVKGLAAGIGKPFVTVPTLDYLAFGLDFFAGTVVPVIDARKGQVYAALYENGRKITGDLDITFEGLFALLKGKQPVLFTGPYAGQTHTAGSTFLESMIDPLYFRGNPGALTMLAERTFMAGGGSPSDASPLYIRKSEAEIHNMDRS